jgi:hypothetical protein
MRDNEIPNRITNYNREGETRVRRPKTSLMDVNDDMRKAGVRHWRKEDEDRFGWLKFIEDTKTQLRMMMIMMKLLRYLSNVLPVVQTDVRSGHFPSNTYKNLDKIVHNKLCVNTSFTGQKDAPFYYQD